MLEARLLCLLCMACMPCSHVVTACWLHGSAGGVATCRLPCRPPSCDSFSAQSTHSIPPCPMHTAPLLQQMRLVELEGIANRLVGLPGSHLSTEQRKRLTIAVELVSNPSIIFMECVLCCAVPCCAVPCCAVSCPPLVCCRVLSVAFARHTMASGQRSWNSPAVATLLPSAPFA